MKPVIDLILLVLNFIVFVFTNGWAWTVVFFVIGIATFQEHKGAGLICIVLSLLVLTKMIF